MILRSLILSAVFCAWSCAALGQTQPVQGIGTAGSPAGGVLTVQPPAGGTAPDTKVDQGAAAAITAGWPVTDGAGTDTTGTLTSGAGSVIAAIDGYSSAKIQIKGTYAAFTASVLVSSDGGTTTVPLQCAMIDGSQFGSSFNLSANQSAEISCGHQSGDDTLILSTSAGPATGTANVDISPASFPSIDGSTVRIGAPLGASVVAPTTPVSVVEPDDFNVCTGGNTCAATSAATLFTQAWLGYSSASVQVTSNTNASTVTFELSDDNITWIAAPGISASSTGAIPAVSSTTSASTIIVFEKRAPFFRARVSTFTSGSVTVVAYLHKSPVSNIIASIGIAGPLGSQIPSAGVATTSTAYTYGHITTAATTTLKSGAGMVHTICVNSLGTVASSLTVDDATSATTPTIAVINSLTLLGCQTFDVAFATGLTIVSTGTVAPDVTVSYR